MKHILTVLTALLLAAALLPAAALAEEAPLRTLTVRGTATVTVPADTAVISLGVETSAQNVADASAQNARRIDAVLAALAEAGIAQEDIKTDYFYVNTLYDYSSFDENGGNRIKGYQVTNGLSVTVRTLEDAGKVIDIALQAGANACNGISFRSQQAGEANDDALVSAIAEGRRKAELMAKACGMTLGSLVTITENSGTYGGVLFAKGEAETVEAAMDRGTQIISNGLDYTATVIMTFEMK